MRKLILTAVCLFALFISGNLMATTYITSNGTSWVDGNGNSVFAPTSPISSNDSVILNSPANWVAGNLTNNGVIIINAGATLTTTLLTNNGTILLYGTISDALTVVNNGIINGTGVIITSSGFSGVFNNGGTVNGNTGNVGSGVPLSSVSSNTPNLIVFSGGYLGLTSCTDTVEFVADYTFLVDSNYSIGFVRVSTGVTITINDGASLSVCGNSIPVIADSAIFNNGTITVEAGGSLVQTGTNTNSGTGTYQIKQTGVTSLTQYNIWCSPVAGAITINDNSSTGYEVFSGANACDVFTFDANVQSWRYDLLGNPATYNCTGNPNVTIPSADRLTGGDGIMNETRGYFIPGTGTATHTFVGEVYNGSISSSVSSSWNLNGNPYPSALSGSQFLTDNSNVNALYFWADDNTGGTGYDGATGYASYNSTGGVAASSPGSSTSIPTGEIAVAQGFWVDVASGTTVNYTNAQRSTNPDVFFKTNNTSKQLIWLNVKTPVMNNTVLVGMLPVATDNYDPRYDGKFLDGGAASRLVTVIGNDEFSIQAIAPLTYGETKTVSLKMVTGVAGNHVFSEYQRENIPSNVNIYLRDKATNVLHDLTSGDYIVNLNSNQTYDNRFELVFVNVPAQDNSDYTSGEVSQSGDVATGVEDVEKSAFVMLTKENIYSLYNTNGVKGDIQVMDVTGKVVWTRNNVNSNQIDIDLNGVSSGIYIIQVINNNERVYTNKIVK